MCRDRLSLTSLCSALLSAPLLRSSPDPTRVFVDVGLGFHVELTLSEALAWLSHKLPSIETVVKRHAESVAKIQGHIKVVYEGIAELMQLQQQQKPSRSFF